MRSKLFHAVVGVGISLGVSACGGVADSDGSGASGGSGGSAGSKPDAKAPKPHPTAEAGTDTGTHLPKPDAGVVPDASPDVTAPDAGVVPDATIDVAPDAPKDAIVDAFCDATWPITKSGREVCGPYDGCKDKQPPFCFTQDAQGKCSLQPLVCVDEQWQCLGGATPSNDPSPQFPCQ